MAGRFSPQNLFKSRSREGKEEKNKEEDKSDREEARTRPEADATVPGPPVIPDGGDGMKLKEKPGLAEKEPSFTEKVKEPKGHEAGSVMEQGIENPGSALHDRFAEQSDAVREQGQSIEGIEFEGLDPANPIDPGWESVMSDHASNLSGIGGADGGGQSVADHGRDIGVDLGGSTDGAAGGFGGTSSSDKLEKGGFKTPKPQDVKEQAEATKLETKEAEGAVKKYGDDWPTYMASGGNTGNTANTGGTEGTGGADKANNAAGAGVTGGGDGGGEGQSPSEVGKKVGEGVVVADATDLGADPDNEYTPEEESYSGPQGISGGQLKNFQTEYLQSQVDAKLGSNVTPTHDDTGSDAGSMSSVPGIAPSDDMVKDYDPELGFTGAPPKIGNEPIVDPNQPIDWGPDHMGGGGGTGPTQDKYDDIEYAAPKAPPASSGSSSSSNSDSDDSDDEATAVAPTPKAVNKPFVTKPEAMPVPDSPPDPWSTSGPISVGREAPAEQAPINTDPVLVGEDPIGVDVDGPNGSKPSDDGPPDDRGPDPSPGGYPDPGPGGDTDDSAAGEGLRLSDGVAVNDGHVLESSAANAGFGAGAGAVPAVPLPAEAVDVSIDQDHTLVEPFGDGEMSTDLTPEMAEAAISDGELLERSDGSTEDEEVEWEDPTLG